MSDSDTPIEVSLAEGALEEAKSSLGVFELKGGYIDTEGKRHTSIEVCEISGDEEDMLASKNIPSEKKMHKLMAACTRRIGPYVDPMQIDQILLDLVVGDRVNLLFAIRRVSLTDFYPFKGECPHCKDKRVYRGNLADLDVLAPADPLKRSFETTTPSGLYVVKWHPMTGRDEIELAKTAATSAEAAKSVASWNLAARIDLINGASPSLKVLKKMSMRDRTFLRREFDKAEGGVDTTMTIICPMCDKTFEREVDPSDPGFFFPEESVN